MKDRAASDSFFGLDLQTSPQTLTGHVITDGGPLTPEIFEEAIRRIEERAGLATCQSPDGSFHHLAFPAYPNICIQCGWDLSRKPVRY